MFNKVLVLSVKKLDLGSALSMRLVKLTRKHNEAIHPKHLLKEAVWYQKYLKKNDTVLDIGCGGATSLIKISKRIKNGYGFDIDIKSIHIARNNSKKEKATNLNFLIHDANKKLPFKAANFTIVICSDVLEHLKKRDYALNEIKRVLKKGGLFLLVTDNPNTSWKKKQKSAGVFYYADKDHKYEYPKEEILNKLRKLNFKFVSISTVTYDTPLRGMIDLIGGISLTTYKFLRNWRLHMNKKFPKETTGYRIVARRQ